jgi:hypothetical protein
MLHGKGHDVWEMMVKNIPGLYRTTNKAIAEVGIFWGSDR